MIARTKVLAALRAADVDFVVVGGLAVIAHGVARQTYDLDVMIDLATDNWGKAVQAFKSIGYVPRVPVNPLDLADAAIRARWIEEKHMLVFTFIDPNDASAIVDVMTTYPIPFSDLKARSIRRHIGTEEFLISSAADLIDVKIAAGRPKDMMDVDELRQLHGHDQSRA